MFVLKQTLLYILVASLLIGTTSCKKDKPKTDDPVVYPPQYNYLPIQKLAATYTGVTNQYTVSYKEGRIAKIANPSGITMTFDYSGVNITAIVLSDSGSNTIGAFALTYDLGNHLVNVKYGTPAKKEYQLNYTYSSNDALKTISKESFIPWTEQYVPSRLVRFQYDNTGNIASYTYYAPDETLLDSVVYTYNSTPNRFRIDVPCILLLAGIIEYHIAIPYFLPNILPGIKHISPFYAVSETHYFSGIPQTVTYNIVTAINTQLMVMDASDYAKLEVTY